MMKKQLFQKKSSKWSQYNHTVQTEIKLDIKEDMPQVNIQIIVIPDTGLVRIITAATITTGSCWTFQTRFCPSLGIGMITCVLDYKKFTGISISCSPD
ncbi:MAG: hypothetical protein ACFFFG_02635 [Candidatus Thorarchaeota archaeon]